MTARIAEVSDAAVTAGSQASTVERQVATLSLEVSRLGSELTKVVRTSFPDVDRRAEPRYPAHGVARLTHAGGATDLTLGDISDHGFSGMTGDAVQPGSTGTVALASGQSARCQAIFSSQGRVGFRFTDAAQAAGFVSAVRQGARRLAA